MKLKALYLFVVMFFTHLFSSEGAFFNLEANLSLENPFLLESIDPATGKLSFTRTDYVIEGIEPILLQRSYSSQSELSYDGGWHFFSGLHVGMNFEEGTAIAYDNEGNLLFFHKKEKKKQTDVDVYLPCIDKDSPNMGFSQKEISARTNRKNYRLLVLYSQSTHNKKVYYDLSHIELITPDGTRKFYHPKMNFSRKKPKDTFSSFYLSEELLPSGNQIHYLYGQDQRLQHIMTYGPKKGLSYASATFKYFGKKEKDHDYLITTDANEKIFFRFLRPEDGPFHDYFYLNEVQIPGKAKEEISYTKGQTYNKKSKMRSRKKGPLAEIIKLENQKTIKVEYYQPGENLVPVSEKLKNELLEKHKDNKRSCFYVDSYLIDNQSKKVLEKIYVKTDNRDSSCHRIKAIYLPSSEKEAWDCIYTFHYTFSEVKTDLDKLSGTTKVTDAHGNSILYHFSENDRVDEIEYFNNNEKKTSSCRFFWKKQEGGENLICKAFKDAKGNIVSAKHFVFDAKGNVLKETIYGNLTGRNGSYITYDAENDKFNQKAESYSKSYTYSQDNFHLTLSEKEDNGRITYYEYLPKTNLLTAKYIGDNTKIYERHFYRYNENHILLEIVHDNGCSYDKNDFSDASYRIIKKIYPKQSKPALFFPETLEEKYFDFESQSEKLLRKTVYHYSKKAEVLQEDIYDADDNKAFSIKYEYDPAKRLIKAKDPLGRVSLFAYDNNDNMVLSKGANSAITKKMIYDANNKLIEEQDISSSDRRVKFYHFDVMGHNVKEISYQNIETSYENDSWGRTVKTTLPKLKDINGRYVPSSIKNSYDVFGNIISITNTKNVTIDISYNLYKKPVITKFSQYRSICNLYNLDGTLAESIDEEGIKTVYKYNLFGKTIEKSVFSKEGYILKVEKWNYKADTLLSYRDPLGNVTNFIYDGAKRKIKEQTKEKNINFIYDPLSRLVQMHIISKDNPKDGLVEQFTYDLIGREIEREKLDLLGNVLWRKRFEYDEYDNKIRIIHFLEGKESSDAFVYDPFKRMIKHIDPLQNETVFTYNDYFLNGESQMILQKTKTDPKGISTVETFDAMQRCDSLQMINAFGVLLSEQTYYYDEVGNKVKQSDLIYLNDKPLKEHLTTWSYDNFDNLIELTEAAESSSPKRTHFAYDNKNRLTYVIKPNRTRINYTYDNLDRLVKLDSSNRRCSYSWKYHKSSSLPTLIEDHVYNQTIERNYDDLGRLISETFPSNSTIKRSYDFQDRCINVIMPDSSSIRYHYDPLHLRQINRYGKAKTLQYFHEYCSYDLSGNLLKENMIYNLGEINTTYDLLARPNKSSSSYYFHKILEFDPNSNIIEDSCSLSKKSLFEYDETDQIKTEESARFSNSYLFDSANNCHRKNDTSYEINHLNQIERSDEQAFHYDNNGNLIQKISGSSEMYYEYDDLDRLTRAYKPQSFAYDFTYDGFNRRTSSTYFTYQDGKWYEKETKHFLYQNQEEIGTIASGQIEELKILGLGKNNSPTTAVAIEINDKVYALDHDLKGNATALIDGKTKQVAEYYHFDSFGNEKLLNKDGKGISSSICPWRFQEKRKDETHLLYFGHRYYDPDLGRWLTPDPSGFNDSMNLYAYTLNNPQNRLDALGLESQSRFDSSKRLCFPLNVITCGFESIFTIFKYALFAIGSILQIIANDVLLPIPIVQNAIFLVGKFLKLDFGPVPEKPYPYVHEVNRSGIFNMNGIYLFINGIKNKESDAIESGNFIGTLVASDTEIRTEYLTSRGFMYDIVESMLLKLGRETPNSRELRSMLRNTIGELDKDGILHLIVHSKGALVAKVALAGMRPEERNRIVIMAYGPATIIPRSYALEARNIFSSRDPILLLNPITYLRHKIAGTANIDIIPSKGGLPFMDHSFSSKTYQTHLSDSILPFLSNLRREHVASQ